MRREQRAVRSPWRRQKAARQTGPNSHTRPRRDLRAPPDRVLSQAHKRTLVQEPREIVGIVRHNLAATEPDEEIEMFGRDALRRGAAGGERPVGGSEESRIATNLGELMEKICSGAHDSTAAKSAYPS
jgi:hypothetical protein